MLKTSSLVRAVLTQVHELTYDAPSGKPEYGMNTSSLGKKVVIEYSSPNIAKSFSENFALTEKGKDWAGRETQD
jgi:arginyl-tRNA synthetase